MLLSSSNSGGCEVARAKLRLQSSAPFRLRASALVVRLFIG